MAIDSLRVMDANKVQFIYKDKKLWNLDLKPVRRVKDKFLKTALKTLSRLEQFNESAQLIFVLQTPS